MGRADLGLSDIKRAQELDPLAGVIAANRGMVHAARGEYDQAIEVLTTTINLNPSWWGTHNWLGIVYVGAGRNQDAVTTLEKAVELNRSHYTLANLAYAYAVTGRHDRAREILKEIEAQHAAGQRVALQMAIVHAGLGDREAALTWLERAHTDRTTILPFIRWLPMLQSVRGEPRFREILRKMNLPE
jgi:Flp pilus assembly protein TadD